MTIFLTNSGHHLLGVSFTRSQKSNLYTDLSIMSGTENSIRSHAQDTTAVQLSLLLTGIHRLIWPG